MRTRWSFLAALTAATCAAIMNPACSSTDSPGDDSDNGQGGEDSDPSKNTAGKSGTGGSAKGSGGSQGTGGTTAGGGGKGGAGGVGGASKGTGGSTKGTGGSTKGTGGSTGTAGKPAGDGGTAGSLGTGGKGASDGGTGGSTVVEEGGTAQPYECGLPDLSAGGKSKPSGTAGNLKVLNWAGFDGAYSYTFDDGAQGLQQHYSDINAAGVHVTFFLIGSNVGSSKSAWQQAVKDGHELGNHSQKHVQNDVAGSDVAGGKKTIEDTFGIKVYTMAAPYGNDYSSVAQAGHFLNRGISDGVMSAGNDSSAFSTPCLDPAQDSSASTLLNHAKDAADKKGWKCILIHGFSDVSDGSWHPQNAGNLKSAMSDAKKLGTVWIDSFMNVGAYWRGQVAFQKAQPKTSGSTQTWDWTLPNNFPPNKCLRVTVDGGTLKQNGKALPWNEHGYYEISLDAKSLTLE